jgi:hypothetical protein
VPTRRCPTCGEWIDKSLLFCPLCRTPLVPITPTHHRPTAIISFGLALTAVVVLIVLAVRWLVR